MDTDSGQIRKPNILKSVNNSIGDLGLGKFVKLNSGRYTMGNQKSDINNNNTEKGRSFNFTTLADLQNDFKLIEKENEKDTMTKRVKHIPTAETTQETFKKLSDYSSSEDSTYSNCTKFTKVKPTGELSDENKKQWEDDINYVFNEDKSKFIGDFIADDYKIMRGYLPGNGKQLRLYYTKFEPKRIKEASLCIVHGFGEHSGRFLDVY